MVPTGLTPAYFLRILPITTTSKITSRMPATTVAASFLPPQRPSCPLPGPSW